jgi:Ala-tRNA(Pro) deacylase
MSINARVQTLLDQEHVPFRTHPHAYAATAQRVAQVTRVPGRDVAKVVVVRTAQGKYLMAVLPASCRLDLEALRELAGSGRLSLAHEDEVRQLFPDCELGAMPPLGRLYDMPLYVDACFHRDEPVFFEAGTHRELVEMSWGEFERLAAPVVGEFCSHEREAKGP